MIDKKELIELFENWKSRLLKESGDDVDFLKVLLKAVIDKIATFPEKFAPDINVGHKWISVSERLLDEDVDVIIYTKTGTVKTGFYTERYGIAHHKVFLCSNGVEPTCCVLAWMPLPDPYKEG